MPISCQLTPKQLDRDTYGYTSLDPTRERHPGVHPFPGHSRLFIPQVPSRLCFASIASSRPPVGIFAPRCPQGGSTATCVRTRGDQSSSATLSSDNTIPTIACLPVLSPASGACYMAPNASNESSLASSTPSVASDARPSDGVVPSTGYMIRGAPTAGPVVSVAPRAASDALWSSAWRQRSDCIVREPIGIDCISSGV
ncbi:hypothetical protein PC123_g25980 [Phytophthora cactorum]|nr:hypothetical protein PC123_g25980 [Phytophthora cactorum]